MKSKIITAKTNSTVGRGANQVRMSHQNIQAKRPSAPVVYRPLPLPRVLQTKANRLQPASAPPVATPRQLTQKQQIQPKVNPRQAPKPPTPQTRGPIQQNVSLKRPIPGRPNTVAQRKATPTPHNLPKRPQPFATRFQVAQLTQNVRLERSQTLVRDVAGGSLAGTTFGWSSNFDVDVIDHKIIVTIKLKATLSSDLFERVWRRSVADKWNNKFMIQANGERYPIEVNLEHVHTAEHYAIKVNAEERVSGSGSRGHFGTQSMTEWGLHDVFNVAHEVGHMLGNVDEYGVVRLSPTDERDYLTSPSRGIMGRPESDPLAHNYYLIAHYAKLEMIAKNIIKPADSVEIKPDVPSRHGHAADPGGPALSAVLAARSSLKPRATAAASAVATVTSPGEEELAKKLAMRRAAITPVETTTTPASSGGATPVASRMPLRRRTPTPTTPAVTATATKPPNTAIAAVATVSTPPPKPSAHPRATTPPRASASSTPSGSSPAKSAPAKRTAKPRVAHAATPAIPTIGSHDARVEFMDKYIVSYIESLTDEQMTWFSANPWRTNPTTSEEAMKVLAWGRK
ncbi:MAG TPA: hypothetical protein VFS77_17995 [Pyrinomonadaceae bacterium]|nr:hypothetical protein [Pyrinomonadaceae bacterium]